MTPAVRKVQITGPKDGAAALAPGQPLAAAQDATRAAPQQAASTAAGGAGGDALAEAAVEALLSSLKRPISTNVLMQVKP